ncbi:hypothetical protein JAB6_52520 [Janthinobacterium sp. HH104]|nr:hypothetical protein JAB6_52520 [Janthinobacterium sp. HH104]
MHIEERIHIDAPPMTIDLNWSEVADTTVPLRQSAFGRTRPLFLTFVEQKQALHFFVTRLPVSPTFFVNLY